MLSGNKTKKIIKKKFDLFKMHDASYMHKRESDIESNAGDFNRWEIGWSESGNILIMNSRDIGNRAWEITESGIKELEMTAELNRQAEKLIVDK